MKPPASAYRVVQNLDDGVDILKAHRLAARLFLGHMIDAEELIVAEKDAFHLDYIRIFSAYAPY